MTDPGDQMTLMTGLAADLALAGDRLARRDASRRRRARFAALATTGALVLGGATAAATSFWQPQLGDDRRGHPTASDSSPPQDQLDRFGVLRRAADAADRGEQTRYALSFVDPNTYTGIRTDYVRYLGAKPDGRAYVLISAESALGQANVLCLWSQDVEGGGVSCWTTDQILAGKAALLEIGMPDDSPPVKLRHDAQGRLRPVGGPPMSASKQRYSGLVPDGVAAVRLTDAHGSVTVDVHDNFFTALAPVEPLAGDRSPEPGDRPTIEWLDAAGGEVGTMLG
jgi:hypothetical protein